MPFLFDSSIIRARFQGARAHAQYFRSLLDDVVRRGSLFVAVHISVLRFWNKMTTSIDGQYSNYATSTIIYYLCNRIHSRDSIYYCKMQGHYPVTSVV